MKKILLFCAALVSSITASQAQAAYYTLSGLYDDCSAYYVAPAAREPEAWIGLTQCSNFIDSVLIALNMPEKVAVTLESGEKTNMLCPRPDSLWVENNKRVFEPSEFVSRYLRYWDHQNLSWISKTTTSAKASIELAFAPRYAPCLAEAQGTSR